MLLEFLADLHRPVTVVPSEEPWTSLTLANNAIIGRDVAVVTDLLQQADVRSDDADAQYAAHMLLARWYTFNARLQEADMEVHAASRLIERCVPTAMESAVAAVEHRRGVIRRLQNADDEAMTLQMQAEQAFTTMQWHLDAAFCRAEMAAILMKRGDVSAAIDLYMSTLDAVMREAGHHQQVAIRLNIAVAMQRAGNASAARPIMLEILSLSPYDQPVPERAILTQNLALMAKLAGNTEEARSWYHDALSCFDPDIHRPQLRRINVSLADLALRANDEHTARQHLEKADAMGPRTGTDAGEIELASTWARLHHLEQKRELVWSELEYALSIARDLHLVDEHAAVLHEALSVVHDERRRGLLEELIEVQAEQVSTARASVSRIVEVRAAYDQERALREADRQHELMRTVIDTHDAALREVGRDLHDSLGQELSVLHRFLQRSHALREELPREVAALLDRAVDVSASALQSTRRISHLLAAMDVVGGRLTAALQDVIDELGVAWPDVEWSMVAHGATSLLPDAVARMLFRAAQGLLQNAIRHSSPRRVTIQVIIRDATVHLSVEDDGSGFDLKLTSFGSGLRALLARAEALGGTLHVDSSRGHGTFVLVTVPLPL